MGTGPGWVNLTWGLPMLITSGQVPSGGLGNAEFNAGVKASKYTYPILCVIHLPHPISTSELLDFAISLPHHWCLTSLSFILHIGPLIQHSWCLPWVGSVRLLSFSFLFSFPQLPFLFGQFVRIPWNASPSVSHDFITVSKPTLKYRSEHYIGTVIHCIVFPHSWNRISF
jgi:hypothetical protein